MDAPLEFRRAALVADKALVEERRSFRGTLMKFGSVGKPVSGDSWTEEFTPNSLAVMPDMTLNVQHDRRLLLARRGAGLEIRSNAERMELEATLPKTRLADDVLEGIRAGLYGGLSVEVRVKKDRWEGAHRIVEAADLVRAAVVDSPAYPASEIEEMRAAMAIVRAETRTPRRKWRPPW